MSFDVRALRRQFPIFLQPVHGGPLHYLDNAATAQTPLAVLDAVRDHETHARANVMRSVHFLAEAATLAYDSARGTMASYLNAGSADEVIFTSGCTAALNLAAHSFGGTLAPGDEILISALDHHSNLVPWHLLRDRVGVTLKPIPVTAEGRLDVAKLGNLVTSRTKLIAVTHASNVTGAETDVAAIVAGARPVGARVLLDGAQRAPHGPVDVQALGIDFYALAGHKMFGPNGVGVLWARRDLLERMPPFMGGGEMIRHVGMLHSTYADPPHRFEAGTPPIAQAVGLAAAADWVRSLDGEQVHAHLMALTGRLLGGLAAIDNGAGRIRVIGPAGLQARLPLVSFVVEGAHPHDICQILDRSGVALRGGHHCAEPLMESLGIGGTTRASLACYNGDDDIDAFLTGLEDAVRLLRQ